MGLVLLVSAVILFVIAFTGLELLYSWRVAPVLAEHLQMQEKYYSAFNEDLAFIEGSAPFRQLASVIKVKSQTLTDLPIENKKGDAATFLNGKVYWVPHTAKALGAAKPLVNVELREEIMRLKEDWIRKYQMLDRRGIDLSLFSELQNYDRWDIELASPISQLAESGEFIPPGRLPVPDAGDLTALARLRLMKGAEQRDFLTALKEVRKLAELLLTTEYQQLFLAGLTVLDHERKAYRYFVDERGFSPAAWQPVDRNVTRRAHRLVLALQGYLQLWTPKKFLEEIFISRILPTGFCSAINETWPIQATLRASLEPRFPMERDYTDNFTTLDEIYLIAEKQCRLRYIKALAKSDQLRAKLPGWLFATRLPYARKVFGMRLSLAGFNGFDAYAHAAQQGAYTTETN